jgi:hypothetical protein
MPSVTYLSSISVPSVVVISSLALGGCAGPADAAESSSSSLVESTAADLEADEVAAAARLGVDHVKPNGRFLHCVDGSSAGAELLLAETDAGDFALAMREKAYQGRTLGVLLETTIDPSFSSASHGAYLALGARVAACRFSATTSVLVDCDAVSAVLADGDTQKTLPNTTLHLFTESRVSNTVQLGHEETLRFTFSIENAQHPFPNDYENETAFDPRACTSR